MAHAFVKDTFYKEKLYQVTMTSWNGEENENERLQNNRLKELSKTVMPQPLITESLKNFGKTAEGSHYSYLSFICSNQELYSIGVRHHILYFVRHYARLHASTSSAPAHLPRLHASHASTSTLGQGLAASPCQLFCFCSTRSKFNQCRPATLRNSFSKTIYWHSTARAQPQCLCRELKSTSTCSMSTYLTTRS